eukprot:1015682-Amphidinium_carterae.1
MTVVVRFCRTVDRSSASSVCCAQEGVMGQERRPCTTDGRKHPHVRRDARWLWVAFKTLPTCEDASHTKHTYAAGGRDATQTNSKQAASRQKKLITNPPIIGKHTEKVDDKASHPWYTMTL